MRSFKVAKTWHVAWAQSWKAFIVLVKEREEKGRQDKINTYEESRKTVDVYDDAWQSYLNDLSQAFTDATTTAYAVQAVFDFPPAPVP